MVLFGVVTLVVTHPRGHPLRVTEMRYLYGNQTKTSVTVAGPDFRLLTKGIKVERSVTDVTSEVLIKICFNPSDK